MSDTVGGGGAAPPPPNPSTDLPSTAQAAAAEAVNPNSAAPAVAGDPAGDAAGADPAADPGAADLAETFAQELAEARRQADAHWDRYLRTQADLDNFRRRAEQLRREALDRQKRDLLGTVLEVADNVGRALALGDKADAEALRAGIASLQRELDRILAREGVALIPAQDQPFDPAVHEAVGAVTVPGLTVDTVVAVELPGYTLNGELLRAARVVVGQGG